MSSAVLCVYLATLAVPATGIAASQSTYVYLKNSVFPVVIESVLQPRHERFTQASDTLLNAVNISCEMRSEVTFLEVQKHFEQVVETFSGIELYRLGPMNEQLHRNRLFYWPEKRRVGERQLRALLNDPTSTELSATELKTKSVAVQGIPALERLLYSEQSQAQWLDDTTPNCLIASSIAANIDTMAQALLSGWSEQTNYVQRFLDPAPDSNIFRNEQEVLQQLVTQILIGVQSVQEKKLMPLVGESADIRKAPLWRSGQSIPMIKANLQSIEALLIDSGLADQTNLEDELRFEFRTVNNLLDKLIAMPSLLDDHGQIIESVLSITQTVSTVLSAIELTLNDRFVSSLGVSAGFNSEDGD